MPDLTRTERAYLAGLWDGEGSITLWKHKRREGTERLIASLVFTNTNLPLVEHVEGLLAKLGATFTRQAIQRQPEHSKVCYQLTARNRESIKRTLRAITPFLIAKKEQAHVVMAYCQSRDRVLAKTKGHPSNTARYTPREYAMEQRIRSLNKRGKERILRGHTPDPETG